MIRARTLKLTIDHKRGDDAIVLALGVIVIIALLWVAGADRSHDYGRSDAPDHQTPLVTAAAGH